MLQKASEGDASDPPDTVVIVQLATPRNKVAPESPSSTMGSEGFTNAIKGPDLKAKADEGRGESRAVAEGMDVEALQPPTQAWMVPVKRAGSSRHGGAVQ